MSSRFTFGHADREITNEEWDKSGMSTFASAFLDQGGDRMVPLGTFKNISTKTFGVEHAEDVFMRYLKTPSPDGCLGLLAPYEVNRVILCVSKSPCSSVQGTSGKAEGCTEELIELGQSGFEVDGVEYKIDLAVIARSLYRQSDGSAAAMDAMRDAGIGVATDAHRKVGGDPSKKEYVWGS